MRDYINNEYIIYKVENLENGLVYIGATSISIDDRKKDHIQKANKGNRHKFHEEIGNYGSEAFSWEQIDTAITLNELAKKEKEYILEFNSIEEGYNQDSGGGFKKSVYQYDVETGFLLNTFDSLESAGNAVSANKSSISNACLNVNNVYKNYYWSYDFLDPYIPHIDKRRKEVIQMDKNEIILAKYKSVVEASRQTGVSQTCISRVCRGERTHSGGFIWDYGN